MDAGGFRASRIPANIPSILAPAWWVLAGIMASMPRVIARGSLKGVGSGKPTAEIEYSQDFAVR
jgi:hypothetical protein